MDAETRRRAVELLERKAGDPGLTYADIARRTGYSERHLKRMARAVCELGIPSKAEADLPSWDDLREGWYDERLEREA